jgi:hypothetical protein
MNDSKQWRQVRVFIKDFSPLWYPNFLKRTIIPFADKYPNIRFWFTQYCCHISGEGADSADTDPTLVPAEYFVPNSDGKLTISIRIRFEADDEAETFLKTKISGFYSDFLEFKYLDGFACERFYSGLGDRAKRADLVSELFYRNSLLVLDLVRHSSGVEFNQEQNNVFTRSPSQSVLHILANIHAQTDKTGSAGLVPLFWHQGAAAAGYYPISCY